jgi:hypothetical protein
MFPVHAHQLSRLFSRFAHDDPNAAQVNSHDLMLTRDDVVRAPEVRDHFRAMTW